MYPIDSTNRRIQRRKKGEDMINLKLQWVFGTMKETSNDIRYPIGEDKDGAKEGGD